MPGVSIHNISGTKNVTIIPGTRYRHYAPQIPVYFTDELQLLSADAILLHTIEQSEEF
ncbi:MAG: hypothetical protein H0W62_07835 [Chitinophagales bacterium]|nr:hypothetical protein [Chitinophagales bacterium]